GARREDRRPNGPRRLEAARSLRPHREARVPWRPRHFAWFRAFLDAKRISSVLLFLEEVMTHSRLVLTMLVAVLWQSRLEAAEDVDAWVEAQMKQQRMPGMALAVAKEGTVVLAKGYGLANVEHNLPVKPETIFKSGSVGKQFTATAVMVLVEEGKLALDDR